MDIEIRHKPIKCPACGHMNTEDAIIVVSTRVEGGYSAEDIFADQQNMNLIFCCGKCPKIAPFKRREFNGHICWEDPQ